MRLFPVMLLVCYNVATGHLYSPDEPCDDGWSRLDVNRCVKYINSPKTFHEAQDHCRSLTADLVSLHSRRQMFKVIWLTRRADPRHRGIWIGAQRSGTVIKYTDGSDFNVPLCLYDPSNHRGRKACIKLNVKDRGSFNDIRCSKKKRFVCAKNVMTSTPDAEPSALQPSPVPDGPQSSPVPV